MKEKENEAAFPQGHWLLTSAGAKVDLTCRMRTAVHAAGHRLFTADSDADSAAFHFSDDHFLLLPMNDPRCPEALLEACRSRNIRVILPTRDGDLSFFARHRDRFSSAGIRVIVSDPETVDLCLDKIRFHDHCLNNGLPVLPRLADPAPSEFPCFVRARAGAAGAAAYRVPRADALRALHGPPPWPDLLVQPFCADKEYSLDALFDEDGRALQWVARERIRIKAGESVVSRTVSIPALDGLVGALSASMRLVGPVTLQAFNSDTAGPRLIEVNPRIGGAAALGIEAGLDTPERLVAWALGDEAAFRRPRPLRAGLTLLRYTRDVFVGPDGKVRPEV